MTLLGTRYLGPFIARIQFLAFKPYPPFGIEAEQQPADMSIGRLGLRDNHRAACGVIKGNEGSQFWRLMS